MPIDLNCFIVSIEPLALAAGGLASALFVVLAGPLAAIMLVVRDIVARYLLHIGAVSGTSFMGNSWLDHNVQLWFVDLQPLHRVMAQFAIGG